MHPNVKQLPGAARSFSLTLLLTITCCLWVACNGSPTEPCMGPLQVGGDVVAPIRIQTPQPQYTEEARQARIQGVVILQAIIDCDGRVTEVMVLQGLPLGLTESAVNALRQWRFEPARLHGSPVSVFYNLSINFRLQ